MKPPLWKSMCKIIVDIGRIEWPEEYPDFIKHIYQLSKVIFFFFNNRIIKQ